MTVFNRNVEQTMLKCGIVCSTVRLRHPMFSSTFFCNSKGAVEKVWGKLKWLT